MKNFTTIMLAILANTLSAQVYNMGSAANVSTCSGTFYDDGGMGSNYGSGQNLVMTFCSATPGQPIHFVFTEFATEHLYDSLIVYNGNSTAASVLTVATGSTLPTNIISSNASNCLTFAFISDVGIQTLGWKATIGCGALPLPPATPCHAADLFCTNYNYVIPATTGLVAQQGPNYDCLLTQPNPLWFSIAIAQAGHLDISASTSTNVDMDFVAWGPYSSPDACEMLTDDKVVDCSYSAASSEHVDIDNAQVGEYYVLMFTNYSNQPSDFLIHTDPSSTAATTCAGGQCHIAFSNMNFANCDTANDSTYAYGNLYLLGAEDTSTLMVSSSFGDTLLFHAPYNAVIPLQFDIPGSADSLVISATFLSDTCVYTKTFPVLYTNFIAVLSATQAGNSTTNTGSVNVSAMGGVPPYSYAWNTGDTTQYVDSLHASTYHITITDSRGCTAIDSVVVGFAACYIDLFTNASTCSASDTAYYLQLQINLQGAPATGTLVLYTNTGYTHTFYPPFGDNILYGVPGFANNGTPLYINTIFTADTGCANLDTATVENMPLQVTVLTTDATAPAYNNGTAIANAMFGIYPFTYSWNTGDTLQMLMNLPLDTYYVTVTDVRGCTNTSQGEVRLLAAVGISDVETAPVFKTMPNPVTDELRFEFSTALQGDGYIYGTDGKLYDKFVIDQQVETLNIVNLPSGVYVIQVKERNSNKASFTRVVKY